MFLLLSIACFAGLVRLTFKWWRRVEEENGKARRQFRDWTLRGLIVPIFLWFLFNSGLLPKLPPLMAHLEFARSAGRDWITLLLDITAVGGWVIVSYWCAVTLAWLFWENIQRVACRELFVSAGIWTAALLPFAIWLIVAHGLSWAGIGLMLWLVPLVYLTSTFVPAEKPRPVYSEAFTKLNFGRFDEAEWEIVKELEQHEDDFEGWMMLAELYATKHRDMAIAEKTICDLCVQPGLTNDQISFALHKLADWHLKLENDPISAKLALGEIIRRFPNSDLAKRAEERRELIPDSKEKWLSRNIPPPETDDLPDSVVPESAELSSRTRNTDALAIGQRLIKELCVDPSNIEKREKLARILAEECRQTDDGIAQLEMLLAAPDASSQQRAGWMRLLAQWELKFRYDRDAARKWLEQIVHECPETPQANSARNRLSLMDAEDQRAKRSLPPRKNSFG